MAAVSSESVSSTGKTLRITYQQLVELAELLEKDKEEKTSKRTRKEVDETSVTDKSPSKYEQRTQTLEQNDETPDSKKSEKDVSKDKKKKDSDRKKHKERKHERKGEENEEFDCKNKSISEPSDGDDNDQLKTKEKKKHRKKSSRSKEKSTEETADVEESLDKLELNDNVEGVKKHKSKHKEEKARKHPDSKKKERTKSPKSKEKLEEDSQDGNVNHRIVLKEEEEEHLNNDQLRHGGILKSPSSKHHHHQHGHVSFSEETESHLIDYKTGEERGILRIPKGVNIHEDEDRDTYYNDNDADIGHARNTDTVFDTQDTVNNTGDLTRGEPSTLQTSEAVTNVHRNKPNEPENSKLNTAEKRLRALNRQRAQQLAKQAHHAENALGNILSKGVTDQATLNKVFTLTKEIQDLYQGVIMLDLSFTHQHDIDQQLWKNAFYQVIETFRKYSKLFLGYSSQKDTISPERIHAELDGFLQSSSSFYHGLLSGLQKTYHFDIQEIANQPRKAEFLARNVSFSVSSDPRCK